MLCSGTAFAYGQTSSGKTFTMNGSETDAGVIPRAVGDIFGTIETVGLVLSTRLFQFVKFVVIYVKLMFGSSNSVPQMSDREFLIRVSYMEIYNEEINDLLVVENQKLQIHESLEVS